MPFAHVLNRTKACTEFIRLSRAGSDHNWRAVAVPLPNGSEAVRVNLALKVNNPPAFRKIAKSVLQAPTTFDMTSNGHTTQVTGRFVAASRMFEFVSTDGATILYSPDAEEPETYESVGAVAAVAVVAILAIAAMAIVNEGGFFDGEAEVEGGSVDISAGKGGGGGDGDGGGNGGGEGDGE